jgi:hypothetical protein
MAREAGLSRPNLQFEIFPAVTFVTAFQTPTGCGLRGEGSFGHFPPTTAERPANVGQNFLHSVQIAMRERLSRSSAKEVMIGAAGEIAAALALRLFGATRHSDCRGLHRDPNMVPDEQQ